MAQRIRFKHGSNKDRQWESSIAHEYDKGPPGSSCLRATEGRQILLDILTACEFDTPEHLWGFVNFYDTIDPEVLHRELRKQGYGRHKICFLS